jgi:hypothetical protein
LNGGAGIPKRITKAEEQRKVEAPTLDFLRGEAIVCVLAFGDEARRERNDA